MPQFSGTILAVVLLGEFSRLGALSVPATLLIGTFGLWISSLLLGE